MQSYISVKLDSGTSSRLDTSLRRKVVSRHPRQTTNSERRVENCKFWLRKLITFLCSQVGVGSILCGYTILGATVFIAIESPTESRRLLEVSSLRGQVVQELWNVTQNYNLIHAEKWEEEVERTVVNFQSSIVREIRLGFDGSSDPIWTFPAALMYSLSVYTTIGYGNLTPKTDWGKAMTIFYALFGIPLLLLYMANVGDLLATSFRQFYSSLDRCRMNLERARESRLELGSAGEEGADCEAEIRGEGQAEGEKDNESRANEVTIPISTCLAVFFVYISVGSILFSWWEGWDYLDGSYFCFVTLVTIGFGDLVPGDSHEDRQMGHVDSELVLCSLYILLGMALMAMCFHLTQERFFQAARKLGKTLHLI